jgi:four helix bundle protein
VPILECRLIDGLAMNSADLKLRTKQFALRILALADALPATRCGNAIANQIVRSGTSVGSNYRAACRGRSRAEFVAKLGVVEEEADETAFWLELVIEHQLLPEAKVKPLLSEALEIVAIMAASRISAGRNGSKSAIGNRKSAI